MKTGQKTVLIIQIFFFTPRHILHKHEIKGNFFRYWLIFRLVFWKPLSRGFEKLGWGSNPKPNCLRPFFSDNLFSRSGFSKQDMSTKLFPTHNKKTQEKQYIHLFFRNVLNALVVLVCSDMCHMACEMWHTVGGEHCLKISGPWL